jgi:hypothetical protein
MNIFLKRTIHKTIFLLLTIISIPFLEFIKVNFFQIDAVIYNQFFLYYSIIVITIGLFYTTLWFVINDKIKVYNLIITIAFSFWLSFKFDFFKTKLIFISKILEINLGIFNVLFTCCLMLLIVFGFYFVLKNKKINNFTRSFFILFFSLQFLFSLFFIFFITIKDKIYNHNVSQELTQKFFSDFELEKIKKNKERNNIYFVIMDGMASLNEYKKILLKNKKTNNDIEKKISTLIEYYLDNDFIYIENSFSTFKDTHHSFSSILNMYPLQLDDIDKNSFTYQNSLYPASLAKNNFEINKFPNLIKNLKKINYDFRWLGYKLNCKFINPNLCYDYNPLDRKKNKGFIINFYILKSFLSNTPAIDLYKIFNKNLNIKIQLPDRKKLIDDNIYNSNFVVISDFIQNIKKFQKKDQKYFYLIHNILPKLDDYYFESDCKKKIISINEKLNNYVLYQDNYECALKKINEMIEFINKEDPNSIVIIQADQGHSFSKKDSLDNYKMFNLIKVPNFCKKYLNNEIDNINAVRLSVSCATNSKVKLLKRQFYDENKFSN